jgi:hypothetical protein
MVRLKALLNKVKWFGLRWGFFFIKKNITGVRSIGRIGKLINKSAIKRLTEEFDGDEGQNVEAKGKTLGFGLIHYAFVRNIKPKRILCVGSRKGFIPAVITMACRDNNFGKVDFVDAGYGEENPEKHWSGIGFWRKVDVNKHFSKVGGEGIIEVFVMKTVDFAKKYSQKEYEYIYIDGDHSYEGVKIDYSLFWPKLKKGGFMVFHDVVAKGYLGKGKFGVGKFWKNLAPKNSIIFTFPIDSGLGIIQKI